MAENIVTKIIEDHRMEKKQPLVRGSELALKIDQTLTQDATGTMAYLQFEAMGIDKVKTELSVSYVDHNTLQTGYENADDHRYLQSIAARYGILYSRAGNGICHQVHLERFAVPGKTLLGSDSHTPTAGGLGMLAIGAGGLDVAVAMAGGPFYLNMPEVLKVNLNGKLPPWVGAKDIILDLLRRFSVSGGIGKIIEYGGPGLRCLSVQERATIANMGAELGATSSVFPSDDITYEFLKAQGREECWCPLKADPGAVYDEEIELDLNSLEPLVALPHSPDAVQAIGDQKSLPVDQVAVGSCTNGSYRDLQLLAEILKGKVVHPRVSLVVSPGSRQVALSLAKDGLLESLLSSGARILESACGPCIGMGQAPPSGGVSVRTFNRNFPGRSGTRDARVYLAGPAVAAAAALSGFLSDPRELGEFPPLKEPGSLAVDDRMIIKPSTEPEKVVIVRGPNIKALKNIPAPPAVVKARVLLKVADNISTDQIMPAGSKVLPLRSNVEALSEHVFSPLDPDFPDRAAVAGSGIIVAGKNYGQGSSREHAALVPAHLGVKAVLSLSFARIHCANLVNFGIIPLVFATPGDYDLVFTGDELVIESAVRQLQSGTVEVLRPADGRCFSFKHSLSPRQVEIVSAGGYLNYTRKKFNSSRLG